MHLSCSPRKNALHFALILPFVKSLYIWTRGPFDRLIVAHAGVNQYPPY